MLDDERDEDIKEANQYTWETIQCDMSQMWKRIKWLLNVYILTYRTVNRFRGI